jgi:hypothetical protein
MSILDVDRLVGWALRAPKEEREEKRKCLYSSIIKKGHS